MATVEIGPAAAAELDAIHDLLERVGLPIDGLDDHVADALVARLDGRIVGSVALERYAEGALLRSVAVDPQFQGAGLGRRLTEAAIARAAEAGVPALYLLTTTAERFFPRFGFATISRDHVPSSLLQSVEFRSACPSSAVVMRKVLELDPMDTLRRE
jgi:amino-acid N-acetyltransferase